MSVKDVLGNSRYHYFYKIEYGDTLSKIALLLYGQYHDVDIPLINSQNIGKMIDVFMYNNPEIKNANEIRAGMCIDVAPFKLPQTSILSSTDKAQMLMIMDQMTSEEIEVVSKNTDSLHWLMDMISEHTTAIMGNYYGPMGVINAGVGLLDSYAGSMTKMAEIIEKELSSDPLMTKPYVGNDIKRALKTAKIQYEITNTFNQSNQMVRNRIISASGLPSQSTIKKTYKIPVGKNLKQRHLSKLILGSRKTITRFKYVGYGASVLIPAYFGMIEISEAPESEKLKVTAKVGGGIALGVLGGEVAIGLSIGLCSLITYGIGAAACTIGAGFIGSAVGGYQGELLGEFLYNTAQ